MIRVHSRFFPSGCYRDECMLYASMHLQFRGDNKNSIAAIRDKFKVFWSSELSQHQKLKFLKFFLQSFTYTTLLPDTVATFCRLPFCRICRLRLRMNWQLGTDSTQIPYSFIFLFVCPISDLSPRNGVSDAVFPLSRGSFSHLLGTNCNRKLTAGRLQVRAL